MDLISTVTVGAGGASSIDFSSIPQTYTDLHLKITARCDAAVGQVYTRVSFNGSSANRNWIELASLSGSIQNYTIYDPPELAFAPGTSIASNTFSSSSVNVYNYTGTTTKTYISESGSTNVTSTAYALGYYVGIWNVTSAITSLSVSSSNGNMAEYSTVSLYGILKA